MLREEITQVEEIARRIAKEEIKLAIEAEKRGPVATEPEPEAEKAVDPPGPSVPEEAPE